jgi:gluconokinase
MVIVVMGVSGCGKSSVGKALAEVIGCDFQDGDDLHPPVNLEKMRSGQPLDSADRGPWLDRVAAWISDKRRQHRSGVVACSALKRRYRDRLREVDAVLRFVFLDVPQDVLRCRLEYRQHFMPSRLLESQLEALERPAPDEQVLAVVGNPSLAETVDTALRWLSGDR